MEHGQHKMPMRMMTAKITTSHINPPPTMSKAKEILSHGEVRGHKLTRKQKGFFGARAGGAPKKYRSSSDGAVKT